jgi:Mn-dependent DtxR family transcriptional regulator
MRTPEESKVLAVLAKEWEFKGPPGIMDTSDIVAALPIAPSDTLAALKTLYTSGLIDMNTLKTSAFLTPEGYTAAGLSGNRKNEES